MKLMLISNEVPEKSGLHSAPCDKHPSYGGRQKHGHAVQLHVPQKQGHGNVRDGLQVLEEFMGRLTVRAHF